MSPEPVSRPDVSVLETMRLQNGRFVRGERHLARAAATADALGFVWDARVAAALDVARGVHSTGSWRARLLIARTGEPTVECMPFVDEARVWRVALAAAPVASGDLFLRYKTTRRDVYERAKAARPHVDDVLLWNERGEITESTIANVVVEIDGTRVTPPVGCGLLPGVFRGALLESGEIEERVVTTADVAKATRLWLINSLREWVPAALVD